MSVIEVVRTGWRLYWSNFSRYVAIALQRHKLDLFPNATANDDVVMDCQAGHRAKRFFGSIGAVCTCFCGAAFVVQGSVTGVSGRNIAAGISIVVCHLSGECRFCS